jgi:hypothetical protein
MSHANWFLRKMKKVQITLCWQVAQLFTALRKNIGQLFMM